MLRQIFTSRTNLQHQLGASISRSSSFLTSSSVRFFSTASSPVEEVDRLPNEDTPWLMLNPEIDKATGDKLERFYSPGENRMVKMNRKRCLKASNAAKCVGSTTGGWLGYVEPYDCSVFLSNPYLNDVVQLPSVTALPGVLDVKHDRSTGAVVGLKQALCLPGNREQSEWVQPRDLHSFITRMFTNMAMSRDESVVLAIQGYSRRAVYCSIGYDGINDNNSSFQWAGLHEEYFPGISFHQAVYSSWNNLFYTMFAGSGIQAFDLETNRKNRSKLVREFPIRAICEELKKAAKNDEIKLPDPDQHRSWIFYLVPVIDDDPLLVRRHIRINRLYSDSDSDDGSRDDSKAVLAPYKTSYFEVLRVKFDEQKLHKMDNREIFDLSLFVGRNQSFSLLENQIPGIRSNCIYFSDDRYDREYTNWGFDYGIFDLSDNSFLPLGCEEDHEKVPFSREYDQFWVAPRLNFN